MKAPVILTPRIMTSEIMIVLGVIADDGSLVFHRLPGKTTSRDEAMFMIRRSFCQYQAKDIALPIVFVRG